MGPLVANTLEQKTPAPIMAEAWGTCGAAHVTWCPHAGREKVIKGM